MLLLTFVSVQPELICTVPDASVKLKLYCSLANVVMGLFLGKIVEISYSNVVSHERVAIDLKLFLG